jgi:S1-C subfamily serine protease
MMNGKFLFLTFIMLACLFMPNNLANCQENENLWKLKNSVVRIQTSKGCGSGTIILREGLILTAYHVVQGCEKDTFLVFVRHAGIVRAIFVDKIDVNMTSLLRNELTTDIALVMLLPPYPELTVAEIDSMRLQEGDDLYFYGFPLCGSEITSTPSLKKGLLSQFYTFDYGSGKIHPFKIDGILNPGNSGGPIIDRESGNVIGMVLAVRLKFPDLRNKHLVTIEGDTLELDEFQPISGIAYGISIEPIVHVLKEFQKIREQKNETAIPK